MRPLRCCGLCQKGDFLKVMAILVIMFDLVQCGIMLYFMIEFINGTKRSHFRTSYCENKSDEQLADVE